MTDPRDPSDSDVPAAPPPPADRAAMPSRLAGAARKARDKTTFGHTAEVRATVPQFGGGGPFGSAQELAASHRHQATVGYEAGAALAVEQPPPGIGLDDLLARRPFDADRAIATLGRIGRALSERHAAGRGHGGLTPRHIRFVPDERGDVVILEASDLRVDEVYEARYEAPELSGALKTRTVQPTRSDVYALGAIFFEMIVGEPPFSGQTAAEIRRKHAGAAVPGARQANVDTDLPPPVEVVLQRALKKRPGDRPADAMLFAGEVVAANSNDDRGTMQLTAETADFLKEILEAKSASEKTKLQVEEEKRRVEAEKRRAEEESARAVEEAAAAEGARRAAEAAQAAAQRAQQGAEKRKRTLWWWIGVAALVMVVAGAAAAWFLTRDPEIVTKTETVTRTVKETVTKTEVKVVEKEVPVYIEAGPTEAPDAGSAVARPRPRPRPRPDEVEAPTPPPKPKPSDGPAVF